MFRLPAIAFCGISAFTAMSACAQVAYAPPPLEQPAMAADSTTRIGRVSVLTGEASYFAESMTPAQWVRAELNLPITSRSSLATQPGARAEVRIGSTSVLIDGASQADFVRVADASLVVSVARGSVALSIPVLSPGDSIVLAGPVVQLRVQSAGGYSIGTNRGDALTVVKTHGGQAAVDFDQNTVTLTAGRQLRIDDSSATLIDQSPLVVDAFDQWSSERSRTAAINANPQYVSPELTGAEALASNGTWSYDANYGPVWYPTSAAAGWEPYRDGHWTSMAPWGRIWIDAAPWGFATTQYGRWVTVGNRWCWAPGPHAQRPVFAPSRIVVPGAVVVAHPVPWRAPPFVPASPRYGWNRPIVIPAPGRVAIAPDHDRWGRRDYESRRYADAGRHGSTPPDLLPAPGPRFGAVPAVQAPPHRFEPAQPAGQPYRGGQPPQRVMPPAVQAPQIVHAPAVSAQPMRSAAPAMPSAPVMASPPQARGAAPAPQIATKPYFNPQPAPPPQSKPYQAQPQQRGDYAHHAWR